MSTPKPPAGAMAARDRRATKGVAVARTCAALCALALLAACGADRGLESVDTPPTEAGAAPTATHAPTLLVSDDLVLEAGECTHLEWQAPDAIRVYLDGRGVEPAGREQVCPDASTTYTLTVVSADGSEEAIAVAVEVVGVAATETAVPTTAPPTDTVVRPTPVPPSPAPTATATPAPVAVEFFPDNGEHEIPADQMCTAVVWRTSGVTSVQLEREGLGRKDVGAEGREEVCFTTHMVRYFLYYRLPDGTEERRVVEIKHKTG